jgi:transmembrane sensor
MTDEKIWQLIILKFTGEATPGQLAELEQALKLYPEFGFQLGILEEIWKNKQQRESLNIDDSFNRHLQRLTNHWSEDALNYEMTEPVTDIAPAGTPGTKKIIPSYAWFISGAAACLILVFWIVLSNYNKTGKPPATIAQNLVSTKNGSKSKLQLPDGTEVWLNSGSKISYGNDFTGNTRQVTLKGEAFFEVVKDASRPFIIHTDAIDIKVLGTAFNVRSYPDEKVTETALIRGSVEITLHTNPDKKIILKPKEKLIVKNDSTSVNKGKAEKDNKQIPLLTLTEVHTVNKGKDSAAMETLWTKNKLVFDGETLQQVALKIERWYGVKVTVQSDRLKQVEYNGVFEDENLAEVLYALQLTGNFNYTIRKNEVIIKP